MSVAVGRVAEIQPEALLDAYKPIHRTQTYKRQPFIHFLKDSQRKYLISYVVMHKQMRQNAFFLVGDLLFSTFYSA